MAIALTLQQYLSDHGIDYELMTHDRTKSASQTAQASHVPADRLAKGVVLTREGGYVMAVLPASRKVRLDVIEEMLHCSVGLATEDEVTSLFPDCSRFALQHLPGAVCGGCRELVLSNLLPGRFLALRQRRVSTSGEMSLR